MRSTELFQTRGCTSTSGMINWICLCSVIFICTSVEGWSYHYSEDTMNWTQSRAWCREHHTDMVAIQNQEEIAHLMDLLPQKPTYYWIGIRKINDVWTWVGTNKALTKEATNWAKGEPNNGKTRVINGESEDCVEMYIKRKYQAGKWNDEKCGNMKTALCYSAACRNDSCIYGECVETINNHRCECFEGFYGEKCENVVYCNKDEVTVPDKGSVSCTHKYGDFSYDSACQYSCEEGYELSVPRPLKCTASETWSDEPPSCQLVQCPELSRPEWGSMKCTDPLGPSSYQSTCEFACDEGYLLDGSDTLLCGATGNWSASQPSCVAVQCPALLEQGNTIIRCEDNVNTRFSFGHSCSFSCPPGFNLVGETTTTCSSAAEWSNAEPHCEAVQCPALKELGNGFIDCGDDTDKIFSYENTCSFICLPGYNLVGANQVTCTSAAVWTDSLPHCEAVQCPAFPELENVIVSCGGDANTKFSYGNLCSFSCAPGFNLVGETTTTCSSAAEWSNTKPHCEAVQCPALKELGNGFIDCGDDANTRFSYGNLCSFSCKPGYSLVGTKAVKCTSSAEWSGSLPLCKAIICPALDLTPNLIMECSSNQSELRPNSTCGFTCEPGFELQGAQTLQCSEDGQWDEATPTCKAIVCEFLEAPPNGHINCSLKEPLYNSQCSFSCDQDYTLEGHAVLTCDHHGNWTAETPTCKSAPSQMTLIASGVTVGGAVSLSGLSLAMWILKRLKRKASKFELSSSSDIEVPPQSYKNSIDSLI